MDSIRKLFMVYLNHSIGLVELQERIDTALVPEQFHDMFWELHNQLEEIRFTKLESNYYKHAKPIILDFLDRLSNFSVTD